MRCDGNGMWIVCPWEINWMSEQSEGLLQAVSMIGNLDTGLRNAIQ